MHPHPLIGKTFVSMKIRDFKREAGIDEGIVVCPISYSTQEWESSLIQQSHFAKSVRRDGATI